MSTFDPRDIPGRDNVDLTTATLEPALLGEDVRRRRARYFDGRFLTARDLTREQQYALIRQADLAQATGGGVISGLQARGAGNARTLVISSGSGITGAGEVVRLQRQVVLDVRNIPALERLDATFGLAKLPGEPTGKRSGLFVLGLRPVEFTRQPTVAYPVGLDDRRRLEEGEIVEATAVTLIPFEQLEEAASNDSRAALAASIFVHRGLRRLSVETLPIAVVALGRGNIVWIDPYLVRRNVGTREIVSFGLGERPTRVAFFFQYRDHLRDVELERTRQGLGTPLPASEAFHVLPPFGPLPRGSVTVQQDRILQSFFPADMNVEVTIVARDELATLADEALAMPAFDLLAPSDTLELNAVLICIPLSPEIYATSVTEFQGQSPAQDQRLIRPTTRALPIEKLDALRRRRVKPAPVARAPVNLAAWEQALKSADRLFYVRRRQLAQVAAIVPRFAELGPADPTDPTRDPPFWSTATRGRLVAAGELDTGALNRFDSLVRRTAQAVVRRLSTSFGRPVFDTNNLEGRLLINAAVAELAYRARSRLEDLVRAETFPLLRPPAGVRGLSAARANVHVRPLRTEDVDGLDAAYPLNETGFGSGLRTLLGVVDATGTQLGTQLNAPQARAVLAASLRVRQIDRHMRTLTDVAAQRSFAAALLAAVEAGDVNALATLALGLPLPPS